MTVKTGQPWSGLVVCKDSTGTLATPSVGPTGALYVDGVSNAASVTVSGTNPYKWAVTLPTLTAGQTVSMYITATIATIATASVVAEDVADTVRLSDTLTANVTELDGDPAPLDNLVLSIENGGYIRANLMQILGTTLTETAGLIAAAFSKFFNKATPTGTINSLPDAVAGAAGGLALAGADGDTLETLSDQLDAIQLITDEIDTSAVTVTTSNNAGELTIKRTATFAATVSGLVIPADWTAVLWTVKGAASNDDDDAVLQVRVSNPGAVTDGLQRIEGAAPSGALTATSGSCTVSQAGGTVAVALKAAATAALTARGDAAWDLRVLRPPTGEAEELTTGTADIVYTVTHTRT